MPPPRRKSKTRGPPVRKASSASYVSSLLKTLNYTFVHKLIFSPSHSWVAAICLIVIEFFINIFVIQTVKYTEIDWVAYMQVRASFLNVYPRTIQDLQFYDSTF